VGVVGVVRVVRPVGVVGVVRPVGVVELVGLVGLVGVVILASDRWRERARGLVEALLEALELIYRATGLILKLVLKFGDPDYVNNGTGHANDW